MESKEAVHDIEAISATSNAEEPQQLRKLHDSEWQTGFWLRFPWIGISSLLTVLVCCAGSVVILVTSDGASQTKWGGRLTPNILLAAMNGIANICLSVAVVDGIAITWWRQTLKGASIESLSRSWAYSTSVMDIVYSLKYFNFIALAALAAKLTIIDGLLMQRATTTYSGLDQPINTTNIYGYSTTTFPNTGTVVNVAGTPGLMEHWMGDTLKLWSNHGGVYPNQWQCDGLCYVEVPGIGFAFDCDKQSEQAINFGEELAKAQNNGNADNSVDLFSIEFNAHYYDGTSSPAPKHPSSHLTMDVKYTESRAGQNERSCPGTKYHQHCRLWPAVVTYPMITQTSDNVNTNVTNIGMTHIPPPNGTDHSGALNKLEIGRQQQHLFSVVRLLPILESHSKESDNVRSKLSGIQQGLDMYMKGKASLSWDQANGGQYAISQMGHSANYMTDPPTDLHSCAFNYSNPLDPYKAPNGLFELPSVVGRINSLMFGLATDISQDNSREVGEGVRQFNGTVYKTTVHYATDYWYMGGAIISTVICVLLVLPIYWGFWQLGRKVTLNPFEIAYAFRSPVVNTASSGVPEQMIKDVGTTKVKYGPIVAGDGRGQFGVSAPEHVAEPPQSPRSSRRQTWRQSRPVNEEGLMNVM